MNSKRLSISIIATVAALGLNMLINFFLTPYIVNNVGSEAYGFVSLSHSFTNYALIITVALNSMAGRFITVSYHKNDLKDANEYFSSTFFSNVVICLGLLVPMCICVIFLERFLNIDTKIINDVKWLFTFIFISFLITLINAAFASATFIKNRKDLEAKRNMESYILKAVVLVAIFSFTKPKVLYVGLAAVATSFYILICNVRYTKKLTPELSINRSSLSISKIKTLISSGVWNSFNRLSSVLSEGLDLLITNLFISSEMMGILAVAKMVPGVILTLIGQVAGVFAPSYTIAYAKNDKSELMAKIRQSMIVMGVLSNICLIVLISIGKDFFKLWVPGQDAELLQQLSIITILGMAINGGIQCIFNIYTITNKIKANSIVSFISNILNVLIVFVLLKTTNLGIYAVAGVSTIITIVRNLLFSIPYAAKCIDIKFRELYIPVFRSLCALFVCSGIGIYFSSVLNLNNWVKLIAFAGILGAFSVITNLFIITNMSEKKFAVNLLKQKLKSR